MEISMEIIGNLVNFWLVAIIFLIVLAIVFKITLKKYDEKSSKIKFYGLFLGMNNRQILSFSMITLNYIFLIWCTSTFTGMNLVYGLITFFFMIGSSIVLREYKTIPSDILFSGINCLCIYVASLLYNYLTTKYASVLLLIVLGLVILFVFLYFTYMTFKYLNNIVLKDDNLKKKDYKKV